MRKVGNSSPTCHRQHHHHHHHHDTQMTYYYYYYDDDDDDVAETIALCLATDVASDVSLVIAGTRFHRRPPAAVKPLPVF